jgi:hypothetical protein
LGTTAIKHVPALGAVRGSHPVIPDLGRLDATALRAQQRLWGSGKSQWPSAFKAWLQAEVDLDKGRERAWAALHYTDSRDVLIDEPLGLAALDLQIGVRRLFGPNAHSEVDGLDTSSSCAGDLIADRLVQLYGQAATRRVLTDANAGRTVEVVMHRMATQIACMSERQLADLEAALRSSFETTASRLSLSGMRALIPAFARLIAPVQVLVLDARKDRGQWSRAWHWFADYGELIEADISRAGWATGRLLLWDRRRGKLVGFPICASAAIRPNCVDLVVFMRSIREPRAIGLGNCALAAMISNQPQLIAGNPLYACPLRTCIGSTGSSGSATTESMDGGPTQPTSPASVNSSDTVAVSWRWPHLSEDDIAAMRTLCRAPGSSFQGIIDMPQQCEISKPSNPFDTYDACMVAASDGATEPSLIGGSAVGQDFRGVPSGKKCNLVAEGEVAAKPPYDRCPGQSCQDKYDPCPGQSCEGKPSSPSSTSNGGATPGSTTSTGTSGATPGSTTSTGTSGATPGSTPSTGTSGAGTGSGTGGGSLSGDAARRAQLQAIIKDARNNPTNRQKLEEALRAQDELDRFNGIDKALRDMEQRPQRDPRVHWGPRDCADPITCSDTCTDLGRQIAAANACARDLLIAVTKAVGRPLRGEVPRTPSRGPVKYPRPDAVPTTANVDICLLGDTAPTRSSVACGLELCTDGFLSTPGQESCLCSARGTSWKPRVNRCLYTVRCNEGAMPDETCTCKPVVSNDPGGSSIPPRPFPEWLGARFVHEVGGLDLGLEP